MNVKRNDLGATLLRDLDFGDVFDYCGSLYMKVKIDKLFSVNSAIIAKENDVVIDLETNVVRIMANDIEVKKLNNVTLCIGGEECDKNEGKPQS